MSPRSCCVIRATQQANHAVSTFWLMRDSYEPPHDLPHPAGASASGWTWGGKKMSGPWSFGFGFSSKTCAAFAIAAAIVGTLSTEALAQCASGNVAAPNLLSSAACQPFGIAGAGSLAVGNNSAATGANSTSIGINAGPNVSAGATSVGANAGFLNAGVNSTSIGFNAIGSGLSATAIGGTNANTVLATTASGNYSLAVGSGAQATGNFSTAVSGGDTPAVASGTGASAFGAGAKATGNFSLAVGLTTLPRR